MEARMWDGLVGVAKKTYIASLGEGVVPRPLMMPLVRGELVGLVWVRPLRVGQDAVAGIAELANIAAAAGADEAHVAYGLRARALGDLAYDLLAHPDDDGTAAVPPGERVRRALALRARLDLLIAQAGVADREDGATWTEIGAAAGITRQAAQERWGPHVAAWAAAGRRAGPASTA
ncbi:hypothetical protein ABZ490_29685 [Streptomyces sp. NPDC005811]|uniref:hypothetical protein n=1 Tax=Streptomyces sp. NPDC005811 TaxID=3154565 RepID=UPI0033E624F8